MTGDDPATRARGTPDSARFLKRYAELGKAAREAVARYAEEVRAGSYPAEEHGYESAGDAG